MIPVGQMAAVGASRGGVTWVRRGGASPGVWERASRAESSWLHFSGIGTQRRCLSTCRTVRPSIEKKSHVKMTRDRSGSGAPRALPLPLHQCAKYVSLIVCLLVCSRFPVPGSRFPVPARSKRLLGNCAAIGGKDDEKVEKEDAEEVKWFWQVGDAAQQ